MITSNGVERDHITIPNPRAPSFLALDKKTGEIEPGTNRDPGENILHGQWSAPSYIVAGGRPQVVFPGGDGWLRSYDPKTRRSDLAVRLQSRRTRCGSSVAAAGTA